jgi:hypothetical protein
MYDQGGKTSTQDTRQRWLVLTPEDRMRFGTAVVVEPRYIGLILHGIVSDGLTLEQRTEDLLLGQECDWSDAMVQPLRQ